MAAAAPAAAAARTDVDVYCGPGCPFTIPLRPGMSIAELGRAIVAELGKSRRWAHVTVLDVALWRVRSTDNLGGLQGGKAVGEVLDAALNLMARATIDANTFASGDSIWVQLINRPAEPKMLMSSPSASAESSTGLVVLNLDAPLMADTDPALLAATAGFTRALDVMGLSTGVSLAENVLPASASCRVCTPDVARASLDEAAFYKAATLAHPPWTTNAVGADCAASLYGSGGAELFGKGVMAHKPAFKLRARGPFVPAFNGELKTADGDRRSLFDAAGKYALLEMHRNYFEQWEDGGAPAPVASPSSPGAAAAEEGTVRHWRFFFAPPLGYSVVGAAPVAWVMRAEWAGRLFLSPVSQPFFIGSDEHVAAVTALSRWPRDVRLPVNLEAAVTGGGNWVAKKAAPAWYTAAPTDVPDLARGGLLTVAQAASAFVKLMHWDVSSPTHVKRIVRGYVAYAAAWGASGSDGDGCGGGSAPAADSGPPPAVLLPAQLLYGRAALAVVMPFVRGARSATEEELSRPGPVAAAVAVGLAWLARHDLLHLDVRPPNVLVVMEASEADMEGGAGGSSASKRMRLTEGSDASAPPPPPPSRVFLVDYDDLRGGGLAALDGALEAPDGCDAGHVALPVGVREELGKLLLPVPLQVSAAGASVAAAR
jgi:hypothetical protein